MQRIYVGQLKACHVSRFMPFSVSCFKQNLAFKLGRNIAIAASTLRRARATMIRFIYLFFFFFLTFTNKSKKTPNPVTVIRSGFVSRSASTEPLAACPGWCSRGFEGRLHENCSGSAAKDWKQGEFSWETWRMSYFLPKALTFGSCQGKILDNVALKLLYLTKSLQPSRYSIRQIKARG